MAHTEEVRLFCEVKEVEESLVQQIVGMVKEAYLEDIRNRTTNFINETVVVILMHLQDNYSQLMPHELLEREDIVKKMIYNPHKPIETVSSAVEELLKFADIRGA